MFFVEGLAALDTTVEEQKGAGPLPCPPSQKLVTDTSGAQDDQHTLADVKDHQQLDSERGLSHAPSRITTHEEHAQPTQVKGAACGMASTQEKKALVPLSSPLWASSMCQPQRNGSRAEEHLKHQQRHQQRAQMPGDTSQGLQVSQRLGSPAQGAGDDAQRAHVSAAPCRQSAQGQEIFLPAAPCQENAQGLDVGTNLHARNERLGLARCDESQRFQPHEQDAELRQQNRGCENQTEPCADVLRSNRSQRLLPSRDGEAVQEARLCTQGKPVAHLSGGCQVGQGAC
jgi:hypothetical protein